MRSSSIRYSFEVTTLDVARTETLSVLATSKRSSDLLLCKRSQLLVPRVREQVLQTVRTPEPETQSPNCTLEPGTRKPERRNPKPESCSPNAEIQTPRAAAQRLKIQTRTLAPDILHPKSEPERRRPTPKPRKQKEKRSCRASNADARHPNRSCRAN